MKKEIYFCDNIGCKKECENVIIIELIEIEILDSSGKTDLSTALKHKHFCNEKCLAETLKNKIQANDL